MENSKSAITDSDTANSDLMSNFNMVAWKAREALMKPSRRSCPYTFEEACAWQYNQLQTSLKLHSDLIFLTCVWNVQSIRFKRKKGLLFTLGNKVSYVNWRNIYQKMWTGNLGFWPNSDIMIIIGFKIYGGNNKI